MPLGKHITGTFRVLTYSTIFNVGMKTKFGKSFSSNKPAQLSKIWIISAPFSIWFLMWIFKNFSKIIKILLIKNSSLKKSSFNFNLGDC